MNKGDLYVPSGELQGDTSPIPDQGTSRGMQGVTGLGGADTGVDSTNRIGSAKLPNDERDKCHPHHGEKGRA